MSVLTTGCAVVVLIGDVVINIYQFSAVAESNGEVLVLNCHLNDNSDGDLNVNTLYDSNRNVVITFCTARWQLQA